MSYKEHYFDSLLESENISVFINQFSWPKYWPPSSQQISGKSQRGQIPLYVRNPTFINQGQQRNRVDLLKPNSIVEKTQSPLVFITKYNPAIKQLKRKLMKYWYLLEKNQQYKLIFKTHPIIAYSKHKNLGDILTSSKIKKNILRQ